MKTGDKVKVKQNVNTDLHVAKVYQVASVENDQCFLWFADRPTGPYNVDLFHVIRPDLGWTYGIDAAGLDWIHLDIKHHGYGCDEPWIHVDFSAKCDNVNDTDGRQQAILALRAIADHLEKELNNE